jgi:hypothetical protein
MANTTTNHVESTPSINTYATVTDVHQLILALAQNETMPILRKDIIRVAESCGFEEKATYPYLKPEWRGEKRGTYDLVKALMDRGEWVPTESYDALEKAAAEMADVVNDEKQGRAEMDAADIAAEIAGEVDFIDLDEEDYEEPEVDEEAELPDFEPDFLEEDGYDSDVMDYIGDAYSEAMSADDLSDY